jgi:hypothetical protein
MTLTVESDKAPNVATGSGELMAPLDPRKRGEVMSTTRTDAVELKLALAAVDRAVNRLAKLVASEDLPTREHARFQLRRLGRISLRRVVIHALKSKEPHRCLWFLEALAEIGQWDAEVALIGTRRVLARFDAGPGRDAALRAIRPLIEAVREGHGSRRNRINR